MLSVCVEQVEEEQQQDKREVLREDMVELRSWNQHKDNFEDDTQVSSLCSYLIRSNPSLTPLQPGEH